MINGILWRTENGAKWRQIPDRYGPWETCYSRFARWQRTGVWDAIERRLQADADAAGDLDWNGQVDSSVVRAHQCAAGAIKRG